MKKQKSNIWAKIVLIIFGIVMVCFGPLWLYDNLSDKTKIFKEAITLVQNELDTIKTEFGGYEYDKTKPFMVNGTLTAMNTKEVVNLSGIYKDNDNYEGGIKIKDNNIIYSLQSNELYLKKDNDTHKLSLSVEELINLKNMVSNYIFITNYNDILINMNTIINGLNNKDITKKRIKTDINNKNTLVTVYSYKLNIDTLNKLGLIGADLENKEYELKVYTKFKKILRIEINDVIKVNINNNNLIIDYHMENGFININKDYNNFTFTMYSNDIKIYECIINKDFNFNIKIYKDGMVIKEWNFILIKKNTDNGVNYIININDSYKLDILLSYNVNDFIDVSNSVTLNTEDTIKINTDIYNNLMSNNVIKEFIKEFMSVN